MDTFNEFIAISRYARWREELQRRETWDETVDRWWNYFTEKEPSLLERPDIKEAVRNRDVFPSMRALMTAGDALDRDHTALYNCAYLEIDSISSFSSLQYILMCGTGVGYSVERRCVDSLAVVPSVITRAHDTCIMVEDSREGWCDALETLMASLYAGVHPTWDTSKVRPKGARLKTFGGRASGPAPLEAVFKFVSNMMYKARGRRLSTLECHDICCVIAQSVIVGGVRRSAMISLSDLEDREMANAKSGNWFDLHSYRSLANNSAVYNGKPTMGKFMEEWSSLYNSFSGERGILNREALEKVCARESRSVPEDTRLGTNPCSEIILRPNQFCNLSTIVVRDYDTLENIVDKIEMATILGTIQSKFTYFPYLSKTWKDNSEDERLLGVSMTGIFDNLFMSGQVSMYQLIKFLGELKTLTIEVNKHWAEKIGTTPSKAITCIKPEGTTSCLAGSSSGLHPQYAPFYLRRVRIDKKDPLYNLMSDLGVQVEDCVMNPESTAVFSFAMKAPTGALTTQDLTAEQHLILWRIYADYYCMHKPSVTINYTDEEYLTLGSMIYANFDSISGISFLPKTEHTYEQAPFEQITEEEYKAFNNVQIDFTLLPEYEKTDTTTSSHTMACTAGGCELK